MRLGGLPVGRAGEAGAGAEGSTRAVHTKPSWADFWGLKTTCRLPT